MSSLGVYCGSFNPIHNGHVQIINEIIEQKLVDKVLIIPTEEYWHKQSLLPLKDRIEMIKLCEIPNLEIDTVRNNIPYTVDILDDLSSTTSEMFFIIGADNLPRLNEWNRFNDLIQYNFIIVPRNNIDIEKYMQEYGKKNYRILKHEENSVSSSYVLKNFSDPNIKNLMPEKVAKYLTKIV